METTDISTPDPEDVKTRNIVRQLQVGPLWNVIHPGGGVDKDAKDVLHDLSRSHTDVLYEVSGAGKFRKYMDSLKNPSILQKLTSYHLSKYVV